jgi:hypothetical protein
MATIAAASGTPSKPQQNRQQPRPQPAQPSIWHGVLASAFDVMGEAPSVLSTLTFGIVPANVTARALDATVLPVATAAMHGAQKTANAYDAGMKWWDDATSSKQPKGSLPQQAAWHLNSAFDATEKFLTRRGVVQDSWDFVKDHWKSTRRFLKQESDVTKEFFRDWARPARKAVLDRMRWAKKAWRTGSPTTWRLAKNVWKAGGEILEKTSHLWDKYLGPWEVTKDLYDFGRDAWHGKVGDAIEDLGWAAYDTASTVVAWGGKPLAWASEGWEALGETWLGRNAVVPLTRWAGRNVVSPLARFAARSALPFVEDAAMFIGEDVLIPAAEGLAAFLGADALAVAAPLVALGAGAYGLYYAYEHPKETKEFFYDIGADLFGDPKLKAQSGRHPWADLTASSFALAKDLVAPSAMKQTGVFDDLVDAYRAVRKIGGIDKPRPGETMHPVKQDWGQLATDALWSMAQPFPTVQDNSPASQRQFVGSLISPLVPQGPAFGPVGPPMFETPRQVRKLMPFASPGTSSIARPTIPAAALPRMQARRYARFPSGTRGTQPSASRRVPAKPGSWGTPRKMQAQPQGPVLPRPAVAQPYAPPAVRPARPSRKGGAASKTEAEIRVQFDNMPVETRDRTRADRAFPFETGKQFAF